MFNDVMQALWQPLMLVFYLLIFHLLQAYILVIFYLYTMTVHTAYFLDIPEK